MNFEIVPGERKNNLVIYENQKFFKTKFIQCISAYKWKCIKKNCNAKIFIDENLTEILEYDARHTNHEKQSSKELKTKSFSNQLKRKLGVCTGTPSKIVNQEILNDPQIQKLITSGDVYNIKQCINRERRKRISLSKNRVEIIADPSKNFEVKSVEGGTSNDGNIVMSSENGQSVPSPRSSIASNVQPIGHLNDILIKQEMPGGPDEYVRPSVIVWNPSALLRQTTLEQTVKQEPTSDPFEY